MNKKLLNMLLKKFTGSCKIQDGVQDSHQNEEAKTVDYARNWNYTFLEVILKAM